MTTLEDKLDKLVAKATEKEALVALLSEKEAVLDISISALDELIEALDGIESIDEDLTNV